MDNQEREEEKTKKGRREKTAERLTNARMEHENMAHGGVKGRTEDAKAERIKGKSEARADRQEHVCQKSASKPNKKPKRSGR